MSTGVDVFMPFYIGDYLKDTAELTTEEHGAYLLLLMQAWNRDGYLPNSPAKLCRLVYADPERWPAIWSSISGYFEVTALGLTQKRLLVELEAAIERKRTKSMAGKAGADARWGNPDFDPPNGRMPDPVAQTKQTDGNRNAAALADGMRPQSQNDALHSSSSSSPSKNTLHPQKPPSPSSSSYSPPQPGSGLAVLPPLPPDDNDVKAWAAFGAICGVRRKDPEALTAKESRATDELSRWCALEAITAEEVHAWGEEWFELKRRQTGKHVIDPPTCPQLKEHFAGMVREEVRGETYAAYVQR